MRIALSISLAFALTLACSNSAGQQVRVEGSSDCGIWVKTRKENRAILFEMRLMGLLDGVAMGRLIDIWGAQGVPMSKEQVYLWMDKYCQLNPLSYVQYGADDLANERTKGAYRRRAERLPKE